MGVELVNQDNMEVPIEKESMNLIHGVYDPNNNDEFCFISKGILVEVCYVGEPTCGKEILTGSTFINNDIVVQS